MIATWENTSSEIKALSPLTAILPLAEMESAEADLPMGTNQFIVNKIAQMVGEELSGPTYLLPAWPYGNSRKTSKISSPVALGYETLWAVVKDIVLSLYAHDIRQIVVINSLGTMATSTSLPAGNTIVKTAVRQLNYETPGLTAIWMQPFAAANQELKALFPLSAKYENNLVIEASMMKYLKPNSNMLDNLVISKEISAENGEKALGAVVRATVQYIQRTSKALEWIQ